MKINRYQSLFGTDAQAFMKAKIEIEKKRRPLYGMGIHVPGNKHPGQYCGGHHFNSKYAMKSEANNNA